VVTFSIIYVQKCHVQRICDLLIINHPSGPFFDSEQNSCEVCILTQLIEFLSYFYEIFSLDSTQSALRREQVCKHFYGFLPPFKKIFLSFSSNPGNRGAMLGSKAAAASSQPNTRSPGHICSGLCSEMASS